MLCAYTVDTMILPTLETFVQKPWKQSRLFSLFQSSDFKKRFIPTLSATKAGASPVPKLCQP